MVTKEDVDKAARLIADFNKERNLALVKPLTCCVCKERQLNPINPEQIHPSEQDKGMWDGGIISKITAGYGSRRDMESFFIAICDECIDELEKEGLVRKVRDVRKEELKYGK